MSDEAGRGTARTPAAWGGGPIPALTANPERPATPRVVAFGGGTGMAALLRGLREYTGQVTAVVTVTDNGGSSGRLRNDFDIVAPGDIRNCLLALADVDPLIADVFQYRFSEAEFKDHCFGNLFITVLARVVGDFESSIRELNRLLKVKGRVVPATSTRVSLVAHHPDGTKSTGEVQITRSGKPIERVELRPSPVPVSAEILNAVEEADVFVFGPGSLYTSVIPNLLLDGLVAAINATRKPRIYIGNIMTQPGETLGYKLSDHIRALRRHVGEGFPDIVVAHSGETPPEVLAAYEKFGAGPVVNDLSDLKEFRDVRCVARNFLPAAAAVRSPGVPQPLTARHDPALLSRVLYEEILRPWGRSSGGPAEGVAAPLHCNQVQSGRPRAASVPVEIYSARP